jgi:2-polyprenyl-3-methyl-5-hydroxy-6-metoxy-1,4-benzoquinol methylase
MSKFAHRSAQTELIDEPGIPFSDWEICLHELNTVNTYLGGHKITVDGVNSILEKQSNNNPYSQKQFIICEIGCGGGDNLKAIASYFKKIKNNNLLFKFIGVDLNKACTDFAARNCNSLNAEFICSDYRDVSFTQKPDIIFNSLFCHHFTNAQLVEMLKWMKQNSVKGFFINDLQRHPFAYHSIKTLTKLFSRSYLVKNDGPISVLRGFHKNEWQQLMAGAGIEPYSIKWRWAFRYLVAVKNE